MTLLYQGLRWVSLGVFKRESTYGEMDNEISAGSPDLVTSPPWQAGTKSYRATLV